MRLIYGAGAHYEALLCVADAVTLDDKTIDYHMMRGAIIPRFCDAAITRLMPR